MLTKGQLLFLIVQYLTKKLSKVRWTLFVQYAAIFNRQKGTHCCREITCFRDNFHCVALPVQCTNPVVVINFRPRNMSREILRSGVRTKWLRFFNESHSVQTRRRVVPKCAPVFVVVRRWRSSRFCFIVYNKTISVFRKLEIIVPICINVVLFNFLDKKMFSTMSIFLYSMSVKY